MAMNEMGPEDQEEDPFDAFLKTMIVERQQIFQTTVEAASRQSDPDKMGKAMELRKQLPDVPVDTITRNLDEAQKLANFRDANFGVLALERPATAKWLSDPENAMLAFDDIKQLGTIEKYLKSLGGGAASTVSEASGGVAGYARENSQQALGNLKAAADKVAAGESLSAAEWLSVAGDTAAWFAAQQVKDIADPVAEKSQKITEALQIPLEQQTAGTDVAQALGNLTSLAAVYMASAPVGLTTMFFMGSKQQFDRGEKLDASPEAQLAAATLGGLATMASEKIGLDILLKYVPHAIRKRALRRMAGVVIASGVEGAEEWVEGVMHRLISNGVYDTDEEILEAPGREEMSAAAAAAIFRTAIDLFTKGRMINTQAENEIQDQQERFKRISEFVVGSKTYQRSKDKFGEFVQAASDNAEVQISASGYQEYLQSLPANEMQPAIEALGVDVQTFNQAVQDDADLTVPVSKIVGAAESPYLDGMLQDVRMNPGDQTAREKLSLQYGAEQAQKDVEAMVRESERGEDVQTIFDEVSGIVNEGLKSANRFTADVNAQYGTLHGAYAATMVESGRATVEQMRQYYGGLKTQAEMGTVDPDGITYDHEGKAITDSAPFKTWFGESKVTDEGGKPLVMYHGTTDVFETFDKEKIRPDDYDAPVNGFWFSSESTTTPAMRDATNVMPVYLTIKNPAPWQEWKKIRSLVWKNPAMRAGARSYSDEARYRLQDAGYDGYLFEVPVKVDREVLERDGQITITDDSGRTRTLKIEQRPEVALKEITEHYNEVEILIGGKVVGTAPMTAPGVLNVIIANKGATDQLDENLLGAIVAVTSGDVEKDSAGNVSLRRVAKSYTNRMPAKTGKMVDVVAMYTDAGGHILDYESVDDFENLHNTTVAVAFEPNQIKSAIGNRGTFDPNDPNILYQSEEASRNEDRAWGDWKPERTKAGVIRGAPAWVNKAKDRDKALNRLYALLRNRINEGIAGRFWYEESARAVLRIVGGDLRQAERFIQLLAIYSPQANVEVNTLFAVKAWNQFKNGVTREEWSDALNIEKHPLRVKTAEQDNKAIEVLYDNVPFDGRKTNSFYLNLMHEIIDGMTPQMVEEFGLNSTLSAEDLKDMHMDPALAGKVTVADMVNKPVTIDMWMYRAFEYENEAAGNDKGTGAYSFSENAIRRITARLNRNLAQGEPRWLPHQVQAAIWTAMKSRYELKSVKDATWKESIDSGYAYIDEDGNKVAPSKVEDKRKHMKIWHKHAMRITSEQATKEAEQTSASFANFLDRMVEVVTWEALPSEDLGLDINNASTAAKRMFTREAKALLISDDGIDLLAARLGVPLSWIDDGSGAYDSHVNPNNLTHLLPTKGAGQFSRDEVRAYARAIQYIFKQDSVPWFRADPRALLGETAQGVQRFRVTKQSPDVKPSVTAYETLAEAENGLRQKRDALAAEIVKTEELIAKRAGQIARQTDPEKIAKAEALQEKSRAKLETLKKTNFDLSGGKFARGAAMAFPRELTSSDLDTMVQLVDSIFGKGRYGFTKTAKNEVSIINFRDDDTGIPIKASDETFLEALEVLGEQLEQQLGLTEITNFWAEGEYGYVHDWGKETTGEEVLDKGGLAGRSDLHPWIRDRRDAFEALIARYSGDNLRYREQESRTLGTLYQTAPTGPDSAGTVQTGRRLPVRADGRVPLTHWGRTAGLTALDPDYFGKGAAGREKSRAGFGFINRTYYGLPGYNARRDPGVVQGSAATYFTTIDPADLYDLSGDPDGLHDRVQARLDAAKSFPGLVVHVSANDMENAIRDAGYRGYWVDDPQIGPVAAVFEPLQVEEVAQTNEPLWWPDGGKTAAQAAADDRKFTLDDPQAQARLDAMYAEATARKGAFDAIVQGISADIGGRPILAALKSRKRTVEKVNEDYEGDPTKMKDLLRATVEIKGLEDGPAVLEMIKDRFKTVGKDRLSLVENDPSDVGYVDMKFNIDMDGHVAELQVNINEFLVAKEMFGHFFYDVQRVLPIEQEEQHRALTESQKAIYAKALEYSKAPGQTDQNALVEDLRKVATEEAAKLKDQYGFDIKVTNSSLDIFAPFLTATAGLKGLGGASPSNLNAGQPPGPTATGMPSTSMNFQSSGTSANDLISGNIESPPGQIIPQSVDNTLYQPKPRGARGSITFPGTGIGTGPTIVRLFEGANLSTFLHESGHFFLEVMRDLAAQPGADPALTADLETLYQWFGTRDIGVAQHEQFARGFEAYLYEGRAPSVELQGVFAKFKAWLIHVYRQVKKLDVTLTDDVRGVMDRMLATKDAIAAAEKDAQMASVFADEASSGMTEAEYALYEKTRQRAREAAEADVLRESMDELRRVHRKAFKDLQASIVGDVKEEIAKRPEQQAKAFLMHGKTPLGEPSPIPHVRLSPKALREMYGTEKDALWRRLPFGANSVIAADGEGVHPDMVAEIFGFPSGDDMIQAMVAAPSFARAVAMEADVRVREQAGDMTNPAELAEAAQVAVNSQDERTAYVDLEYRALAKQSGEKPLPRHVIKKAAERIISQTKVRHLRPGDYLRKSVRAADEAAQAFAKGEKAKATDAKRRQLLNMALYRLSRDARERADVSQRYFDKFQRPGVRVNLDRDYLDQIDAILEAYNFKPVSLKEVDRRASLKEWIDSQLEQGLEVIVPENLIERAMRTDYRELTVEQLSGLYDSIRNIEHIARFKNKLIADKEKRDFNRLTADLSATARANNTWHDEKIDLSDGDWAKFKEWGEMAWAYHHKVEFIMNMLDGMKFSGLWWRTIFKPIADAENEEQKLMEEMTSKLNAILDKYSKDERASWHGKSFYIRELNLTGNKSNILALALNQGNMGNREAVLEGYGWEQSQVDAALARYMTEQDWQTVQDIWDLIGTLWPRIAELQRELTGVVPERVEATEVTTSHGTLPGGYYPLAYDRKQSWLARKRDEKVDVQSILGGSFIRPMTKDGHTYERVGSRGQRVNLGLSVLTNHIANVTHDLTHRKAIINVDRILNSAEVREAIQRTAGTEVYAALRPWLVAVAGERVDLTNPWEKVVGRFRHGATIVNMGLKLTTAIVQPLGYLQSVELLGTKWAMIGLQRFYGHPTKIKENVDFVFGKSVMMRNRTKTFDRDVRDVVKKLKGDKMFDRISGSFLAHIGFFDLSVSLPTWMAAYERAQSEGKSDPDAVAEADSIVRMSQSAGSMKDLAGVQRGSELMRSFTMFYSYFNVLANLLIRAGKITGKKGFMNDLPHVSMYFLTLIALPAVLSELIAGRGPDDDEEDWAWAAKTIGGYPFQTVVGMRDIARAVIDDYGYDFTPVADALGAVVIGSKGGYDIVTGEGDETDIKNIVMAAGYVFKLPARQAWIVADNLKAMMEGQEMSPYEYLMIKETKD